MKGLSLENEASELAGKLDEVEFRAVIETMKAIIAGASVEEAYTAGDLILVANGRKPYLPVYLSNISKVNL